MALTKGIYYPILTPFTDDHAVDTETLADLVEFGIEGGVAGIFALGSAGQGPAMELEQRKLAMETILETTGGRVPVVAHVGTPVAGSSVELAKHAERAGADVLAVIPPYFYTDHTEYEVEAHYRKIAGETDLDIMIYNNPKYVGFDIDPTWLGELVEAVPRIRGIKASFTSQSTLLKYVEGTPEGFSVFAGTAELLFPAAYHGVAGSIHPPTSMFPELTSGYWDAIRDRDVTEAVRLQRVIHDVSAVVGGVSKQFGRAAYVSLFELRGIEIARYPLWESRSMPGSVLREAATDLLDVGLADEGIDLEPPG